MEEKEKTVQVAPVLNEVQVADITLRSNKDSTEMLIALMEHTLKIESIKEYTSKVYSNEVNIPPYVE